MKKNIIALKTIIKEGLDDSVSESIIDRLCDEQWYITLKSSSLIRLERRNNLVKEVFKSQEESEKLLKQLKKSLSLSKRYYIIYSIINFLGLSQLVSEEYEEVAYDLVNFSEELIHHFYILENYNNSILIKYYNQEIKYPNILFAYSAFVKALKISADNCVEVLKQKKRLCRTLSRKNVSCSMIYMQLDYFPEEDREILDNNYIIIDEFEQKLVKKF